MTLQDLTHAHASAALRYSLLASIVAERDGTDDEMVGHDAASDALDAALLALVAHVPADLIELKAKARYLLSRLMLGDMIGSEHLPALLRSIALIHPIPVNS